MPVISKSDAVSTICEQLNEGRCVLFVGSGVSATYNLKWLLSPVIGVTGVSNSAAALIGVVIPFVAGIGIASLGDALKPSVKVIVARPGKWLKATCMKRARRRELLERILPPGMSAEEYLNQEKKRGRRSD